MGYSSWGHKESDMTERLTPGHSEIKIMRRWLECYINNRSFHFTRLTIHQCCSKCFIKVNSFSLSTLRKEM